MCAGGAPKYSVDTLCLYRRISYNQCISPSCVDGLVAGTWLDYTSQANAQRDPTSSPTPLLEAATATSQLELGLGDDCTPPLALCAARLRHGMPRLLRCVINITSLHLTATCFIYHVPTSNN